MEPNLTDIRELYCNFDKLANNFKSPRVQLRFSSGGSTSGDRNHSTLKVGTEDDRPHEWTAKSMPSKGLPLSLEHRGVETGPNAGQLLRQEKHHPDMLPAAYEELRTAKHPKDIEASRIDRDKFRLQMSRDANLKSLSFEKKQREEPPEETADRAPKASDLALLSKVTTDAPVVTKPSSQNKPAPSSSSSKSIAYATESSKLVVRPQISWQPTADTPNYSDLYGFSWDSGNHGNPERKFKNRLSIHDLEMLQQGKIASNPSEGQMQRNNLLRSAKKSKTASASGRIKVKLNQQDLVMPEIYHGKPQVVRLYKKIIPDAPKDGFWHKETQDRKVVNQVYQFPPNFPVSQASAVKFTARRDIPSSSSQKMKIFTHSLDRKQDIDFFLTQCQAHDHDQPPMNAKDWLARKLKAIPKTPLTDFKMVEIFPERPRRANSAQKNLFNLTPVNIFLRKSW